MSGSAAGYSSTAMEAEPVHPPAFVTVTLYVPGLVITIELVVCPLDH